MDRRLKIIVVAPHQDDETIGCGGLVGKLTDNNHDVLVQHVYSGNSGIIGVPANSPTIRHNEALAAAAVLKFSVLKNLGYSDRSFPEPGNIINKLVDIFREHHPDLVLCPHKGESDKEHQLVNKCCEEAVWLSKSKGYKSFNQPDVNTSNTVTLFYEVWTPILVPSLFIDISEVIARKKKAIQAFSTQLACADWLSGSIGLNAYRGTTLQGAGFCEAYMIEKTNIKHLKQILDLIL